MKPDICPHGNECYVTFLECPLCKAELRPSYFADPSDREDRRRYVHEKSWEDQFGPPLPHDL